MNQNDLPSEVVLHRIGECPVCHKGQLVQGSAGWTCDWFRSLDDLCRFTIFSSYDGYTLTEEDAVQLITEGQTGERDFVTRSGKPFRARLVLDGGKVKVQGYNAVLPVKCPVCGSRVKEVRDGYVCEGFFQQGEDHCSLYVAKQVCGREITRAEVEQLLEHGRTEVLDGFTAQGKVFSSVLTLLKDGSPVLNGEICRCPKCGGTVFAGIKAYNCSNYRNPAVRCDFVVWRNLAGHRMTVDEVRTLCIQGATPVLQFLTKDGTPYARRLVISATGDVKMV